MTLLRIAALAAALSSCAPAATHIVDTLTLNDGATAMAGRIYVTGPSGSPTVASTSRTVTIGTGGALDVSLVGCNGCTYRAQYQLTNSAGVVTMAFDERWAVPDVVATLTRAMVQDGSATPAGLVNAQRISGAGLSSGQLWVWNGSAYVAGSALDLAANYALTGYWNFSAGAMRLPEKLVSTLPTASASTGKLYIATDALVSSTCATGGGTGTPAMCRSDGTSWVAIGGGGGEPVITGGLVTEYWAGTKVWRTLSTDVIAAMAASMAAKASLTAPIFIGQPTITDFTLAGHTHQSTAQGGTLDAAAVAAGILAIGRIPTGTSGSTVAFGNHTHTGVYEVANANIQSHISSTANPHTVTATQVGLGNVTNTSDANKPVSTAQQTALDLKASVGAATTVNGQSCVLGSTCTVTTAETAGWGFCATAVCTITDAIANPYIATSTRTLGFCYIASGTAPTGANLIIQVKKNGVNSFTVTQTAGSTYTKSSSVGIGLVESDVLTAAITQVGSTIPGQNVTLVCKVS
jgi:hypothetical protein